MRLKSIEIANFKAFGKEFQTIPIKPITLVFGPNSAGKSSLLHSLLWLNHAESRGETDVYYPSLVGKSVNLGGFDSCLNRKSGVHRLRLALTIENSALNPSSPKWSDTISHFKLVFTCGRTHKDQSPGFIDCDLFANDDRLLTIRKRSGSVSKAGYNAEFEWNHPALPFASTLTDELQDYLEKWSGFLAGYEVVSLTFLMSKLFLQQSDEGFLDKNENIPKAFHQFLAHELPASIGEIFTAFSHTAHELVYIPPLREIPDRSMDLRSCELPGWHWLAKRPEIADKTNDTLKNLNIDHRVKIRHLLPADTVKESIIRTLAQAETGRDWGGLSYVVENARETWDAFDYSEYKQWLERHPALFKKMEDYWYDIVQNDYFYFSAYFDEHPEADKEESVPSWWIKEAAGEQAMSLLNDWGSNDTVFGDEAARLFISEDQGVRDAIMNALKERGIDNDLLPGDSHLQLRLHDPECDVWVALQDVGVGTSQVLPIILEAFAQENKLIAIEQPELHLHPALQAELGDVFIESALGENENTFLLETHSEHLILRILRRIRETTRNKLPEGANPVRPDDIAVLYVEPGADGSVVRELRVNDQGRFIDDWPNGFFEERFNEEF